jgi:hypothetical protein
MKKHLPLAAMLLIAFASFCFAQPEPQASPSPKPKPAMTKAQMLKKLSAQETKLWDAWKNKDPKPFQAWLSADSVMISEDGIGMKNDVVKMLASMPCEVKSFTLSDWKMRNINAGAVLLTYKALAEGTCGGNPIPNVWSSTVWVNRGGKWLAFSHQETPIKR